VKPRVGKVVIAAGGTAGHVVPALAVADALRADGVEVAFIGADRAEAQLVPAAGYALHRIAVRGMSRRNPLRAARALLLSARAVRRSRSLLGRLAPDAVMGGGGYVAAPVVLAALLGRVPVVLTEADHHLGLTNRLLAPFARTVCLAFAPPPARPRRRMGARGRRSRARSGAAAGWRAPGRGHFCVTGRPIPPPSQDAEGARRRLQIAPEETCVLVFGGSLGAHSINIAALEAFAGSAFAVLHICGRRDYPELSAHELRPGYRLIEYLEQADFADALAASDLVVARAGGSIFEIAAHGVPAILIPYPHATRDHQSANARWMSEAGAALTIPDGELSPARLAREVAALLGDRARLAEMARAARALARVDAAREVAHEILVAGGG
jgi:UDP-N-acetylglucosamine--N-acetylmuramyl-(pentapeptide) pyrophosphoryl-undecaprenol N-acetylglucosamine transferase